MYHRGEEKHGEKREERQLKREIYGKRRDRISDSEGVRRETAKGREKKWENLPWEREDAKKLCFSWL